MSLGLPTPRRSRRRWPTWCPEYRPLVTPSPGEEPVSMAAWSDPAWLAARVAASHRRYRTDDARVAATLWWFSASTALLTPALATLVVTRWAVDPRPAATVLHMRRDGLPSGARSPGVAGQDPAAVGAVVGEAVAAASTRLAEAAPLRPRAGWAIAVERSRARRCAPGPRSVNRTPRRPSPRRWPPRPGRPRASRSRSRGSRRSPA
ncbi:hypothetical protein ACU686_45095 [Yinghuangia aomiensis]